MTPSAPQRTPPSSPRRPPPPPPPPLPPTRAPPTCAPPPPRRDPGDAGLDGLRRPGRQGALRLDPQGLGQSQRLGRGLAELVRGGVRRQPLEGVRLEKAAPGDLGEAGGVARLGRQLQGAA